MLTLQFAGTALLVLAQVAATPASQPSPPPEQPRAALGASDITQLRAKAEAGDASAQLALARAYADGNGVRQNDDLAAAWCRKAADQGNAAAENELGIMYREGRGVEKARKKR